MRYDGIGTATTEQDGMIWDETGCVITESDGMASIGTGQHEVARGGTRTDQTKKRDDLRWTGQNRTG